MLKNESDDAFYSEFFGGFLKSFFKLPKKQLTKFV